MIRWDYRVLCITPWLGNGARSAIELRVRPVRRRVTRHHECASSGGSAPLRPRNALDEKMSLAFKEMWTKTGVGPLGRSGTNQSPVKSFFYETSRKMALDYR
jgi:hypothetical protein